MIDLTGRVAIVTGAAGGLGRAHALLLARRGASVVVNDLGVATDGNGRSLHAAEATVSEIEAFGGRAMASDASVTDLAAVEAMVADTIDRWGRVDILVNNAGILRDRSFAKMDVADFRAVVDVHLMGAVHCTKAVWDVMRGQGHGRIVMTTSSSGLFGNFGQSNYGAAKMALVGLMQTLGLEGERHGIRVNCLAPSGATRMVEGLLPQEKLDLLSVERVSPAVLLLVSDEAPTRKVILAGAGSFEQASITMNAGVFIGDEDDAAERLLERFAQLTDRGSDFVPETALVQAQVELAAAGYVGPDGAA